MLPLRLLSDERLRRIQVLVSDIDGTLTDDAGIAAETMEALEQLSRVGVRVILATGRSAGWAHAIACYLPGIDGVVAENGLVMTTRTESIVPLGNEVVMNLDPGTLDAAFHELAESEGLSETSDNRFRMYERTLVRPRDFGVSDLERLRAAVRGRGLDVLASAIHLHLHPAGWDKGDGVRAAITRDATSNVDLEVAVMVVGDSGNDAPLFREFPELSVGVANIQDSLSELDGHLPMYVTEGAGGVGFRELARRIFNAKTRIPSPQ
jgi:HAD superfamily hydrolase (TIGR01484 family)